MGEGMLWEKQADELVAYLVSLKLSKAEILSLGRTIIYSDITAQHFHKQPLCDDRKE